MRPAEERFSFNMIRRILAIGVSATALAVALPASAQDAAAERTPPPQMSFGTWGIDPTLLDPAVDPGDDFFAYANRKWLAANPLTDEFARYGAFDMLGEKSTADVERLVADLVASNPAAGSQARRIVEEGKHAKLSAAAGLYARLAALQFDDSAAA